MRIDDPQVLKQIEHLEATAATLRRLAGFQPLNANPDTYANRLRHWCQCNRGFQSRSDLEHHQANECEWKPTTT